MRSLWGQARGELLAVLSLWTFSAVIATYVLSG